jgi:hypothetical protein
MTREEHLQWAKDRAIEYCDRGDPGNAFASFQSDMSKHEETRNHRALEMMTRLLYAGHLSTADQMRRYIEGFN